MNTSLQGRVPAQTGETRWTVGGRQAGKSAGATENGAQTALDVPVQDVGLRALQRLSWLLW